MVEIKCVLNGVTLASRTRYFDDEKVHRCLTEAKERLCALTGLSHNQLALKVVPLEEADDKTVVIGKFLATVTTTEATAEAEAAATTGAADETTIEETVLFSGSYYVSYGLKSLLASSGLPEPIAEKAADEVETVRKNAKLINSITLSNDGLTFVFDNGMLKTTVRGRVLRLAKKAIKNGVQLRTVEKVENEAAMALRTEYLPPKSYQRGKAWITPPHTKLLNAFSNAAANLKKAKSLQIINGVSIIYVRTAGGKYPISDTMRKALHDCGVYNVLATDGALEIRTEKDADFRPESVVLSGKDLCEEEARVRALLRQILSAKPQATTQTEKEAEVKVSPILADLKGQLLKMREAYAKAHSTTQAQTQAATTSSDMDAIREMANMFR